MINILCNEKIWFLKTHTREMINLNVFLRVLKILFESHKF